MKSISLVVMALLFNNLSSYGQDVSENNQSGHQTSVLEVVKQADEDQDKDGLEIVDAKDVIVGKKDIKLEARNKILVEKIVKLKANLIEIEVLKKQINNYSLREIAKFEGENGFTDYKRKADESLNKILDQVVKTTSINLESINLEICNNLIREYNLMIRESSEIINYYDLLTQMTVYNIEKSIERSDQRARMRKIIEIHKELDEKNKIKSGLVQFYVVPGYSEAKRIEYKTHEKTERSSNVASRVLTTYESIMGITKRNLSGDDLDVLKKNDVKIGDINVYVDYSIAILSSAKRFESFTADQTAMSKQVVGTDIRVDLENSKAGRILYINNGGESIEVSFSKALESPGYLFTFNRTSDGRYCLSSLPAKVKTADAEYVLDDIKPILYISGITAKEDTPVCLQIEETVKQMINQSRGMYDGY